jgi:hypothetical protein
MPAIVPIGTVTEVHPHPNNVNLDNKMDIVTILGKTNVATRIGPDQPRYNVGDYAAVIAENLLLPEWLLRHMDLWDEEKSKGFLAGKLGNRTKARVIQGVNSDVALVKMEVWFSPPEILCDGKFVRRFTRIWLHGDATYNWSIFCNRIFPSTEKLDKSLEKMNLAWNMDVNEYVAPPQ